MTRRGDWKRPRGLRGLRLRRALGSTRLGDALKRTVRERLPARSPRIAFVPQPGSVAAPVSDRTNVALVSHCGFDGNSALHVYAIACELQRRGVSPVIVVPRDARGVEELGAPPFPVLTYADVRAGRLAFPDGRGADVVHAFTPRPHVRALALALCGAHRCPFVVHLEDNESVVGGASGAAEADAFLARAAAVTVVVERLLELKPEDVPGMVVRPGFDEAVLTPRRGREEVRGRLGIGEDELALAYTGNVHAANLEAIRSLYGAVERLREDGLPLVLVKTGWSFVPRSRLPRLGDALRDLGWVAREHVPELLAAADVLVQPGAPGPFDDFRFPSKLPEFLASGRPVVLPRTNVGLELEDGVEALLLDRGDAAEIAAKVSLLAGDPELRTRIGEHGRDFALRELRWERSVAPLPDLYRRVRGAPAPAAVRRPLRRPSRSPLRPRIGYLVHHRPRPLEVPASYLGTQPPRPAPAISIVTPSLQHGRFLARTVHSVLAQRYPALEYVIRDGGSTDGTLDLLRRLDEGVVRWRSEPDDGQADAINRGFVETSGEIMAWLNSDDLLLPGALASVARAFVERPDVDVVYGWRLLIDEHDRQIGEWILPAHDNRALALADHVPQETLFWRRRIWEATGARVDPSFGYALDWDLLLRFRAAGATFLRLPRYLGAFRVHGRQTSQDARDVGDAEIARLLERVHGRSLTEPEVLRSLRPYLVRHLLVHARQRLRDRVSPSARVATPSPERPLPAERGAERVELG